MSKYPLEPLRRLRNRRVDESQRELAERAAETAAAEQRRLLSLQAVEAAEHARHRERANEGSHAESGRARAADWQQLAAFESSARATESALRERQENAQQALEQTKQLEVRSLEALVVARAEAQLCESHRAKFERSALKAAIESEEDEVHEVWSSRVGKR